MHLHHLWARCANLQPFDYARQHAAEEEAQRAEVPSDLEVMDWSQMVEFLPGFHTAGSWITPTGFWQ